MKNRLGGPATIFAAMFAAATAATAIAQPAPPADPMAPPAPMAAPAPMMAPEVPQTAPAASTAPLLVEKDGKWWNGERRATKAEIAEYQRSRPQ